MKKKLKILRICMLALTMVIGLVIADQAKTANAKDVKITQTCKMLRSYSDPGNLPPMN